jgi:serine/threonine protein kinase
MLNLDLVGQQLGNYHISKLLGRGGYAEVYLGEHIYLETQAAIKVLHARLGDEEEAERFRYEARTIARLVHPHIVRVFDFDIQDDVPFLVMDYAPDGSLRKRHPKGSRIPLNAVLSYVRQIASALQYAHDQRLVHRDIKPENMLLGRNDDILLSDFGTALVVQTTGYQSTQQDDVIGTVAYMAPELFQGKALPASDQYALGIVVYEWLSGTTPFHGTATEIAMQHALAPVPSLREKVPALPPMLEEVIVQALAKDARQRYPSVQAFADALEAAAKTDAEIYSEKTMNVPVPSELMPRDHVELLHPQSQPAITPDALVKPAPLVMDTATNEVVRSPAAAPVLPISDQAPTQQQSAPDPSSRLILPAPQAEHSQLAANSATMYGNALGQASRRRRFFLILLPVLALLVLAIAAAIWLATARAPASSLHGGIGQARTTSYPNVAGSYSGSIDNTASGVVTGMALTFQQNQGKLSGQFTVNAPLVGSGPLSGTINSAKHVQFTVQGYHGNAPLLFSGTLQSNGSIMGTYCSLGSSGQCSTAAGGSGTWMVSKGQGNEPLAPVTPTAAHQPAATTHKGHKHGHGHGGD